MPPVTPIQRYHAARLAALKLLNIFDWMLDHMEHVYDEEGNKIGFYLSPEHIEELTSKLTAARDMYKEQIT